MNECELPFNNADVNLYNNFPPFFSLLLLLLVLCEPRGVFPHNILFSYDARFFALSVELASCCHHFKYVDSTHGVKYNWILYALVNRDREKAVESSSSSGGISSSNKKVAAKMITMQAFKWNCTNTTRGWGWEVGDDEMAAYPNAERWRDRFNGKIFMKSLSWTNKERIAERTNKRRKQRRRRR